ncbi:MAG: phosphoribosylamine--glycine ligase [Acidimicrobiia bacterium]
MRVLLVGGGAREHALGWALCRSSRVDELISLPGNPGLAELGSVVEGVKPTDVGAVAALARVHRIDLAVVGPEAPLAAGIADAMAALGIPVFGPTRAAARLESSKSFAKEVMRRAGVATAESEMFTDPIAAKGHLTEHEGPYVVKADGLAAGKGVLVTDSREEAAAWADQCLRGGLDGAGDMVVIEEFLDGPEVSVFAVCTLQGAEPVEPARDYKRLLDDDEGPNTGGMGAFSPVTDLEPGFVDEVMGSVIVPVWEQMRDDGTPFTGFLYAGLVITADGPKVLEFNVRMGDPEAQVVLPRLTNDLVDVLEGATPEWSEEAAVDVVLAAKGYPTDPETGAVITGLDQVPDDVLIFHAGTEREDGRLVVAGGRVLTVVGTGPGLAEARERAYHAVNSINWPGMSYRNDIGII